MHTLYKDFFKMYTLLVVYMLFASLDTTLIFHIKISSQDQKRKDYEKDLNQNLPNNNSKIKSDCLIQRYLTTSGIILKLLVIWIYKYDNKHFTYCLRMVVFFCRMSLRFHLMLLRHLTVIQKVQLL